MGNKDFNGDLSKAQGTIPDGISDLRRGDLDGHLVFLYSNGKLPQPIEIQVLSQDVADYPKSPSYLVFVCSDGINSDLADFIQGLSLCIDGKPIRHILSTISEELGAHLGPTFAYKPSSLSAKEQATSSAGAQPSPTDYDSEKVGSNTSDSDFDDTDYDWDDDFLLTDDPELGRFKSHDASPEQFTIPMHVDPTSSIHRQRSDFRAAKKAGFSVGFYDQNYHLLGQLCSLSIPVRRLGVSEEVMEAWHLAPVDNLVLLLRFPRSYPTAASCLKADTMDGLIQFELGKSRRDKPSLSAARAAFEKVSLESAETSSEDTDDFVPLYLFNSVPRLLGKDLPRLLKARRDKGLSWIEAQEYLGAPHAPEKSDEPLNGLGADDTRPEPTTNSRSASPGLLQQDHALDTLDVLSIPLVAMECCLCLVVNCGTYCVNCHGRMSPGFQTMRPFVCNKDLCLDHYFSLGLGPGIEHEIINSPYVVDLLINFFYVAVHTKKLRWFPRGLGLKVPGPEPDLTSLMEADVNLAEHSGQLTTNVTTWKGTIPRLSEGDKMLLFMKSEALPSSSSVSPTLRPGIRKTLCRIDSVQGQGFTFKPLAVREGALRLPRLPVMSDSGAAKSTQMYLQRYTSDLDELKDNERDHALLTMLCGIPSVLKLRQYLMDHPGQRLSQPNELLDRHTYRLLFWIISSNRSLIVQDEPIKARDSSTQSSSSTGNRHQNKITGLSDEWMQFRFIQGSPEKERRFVEEISQVQKPKTPTLFAWHGSNLGSWHGIVSEGLNYAKTANGRAFGHGVYFSPQLSYSLSYSSTTPARFTETDTSQSWLYSELHVEQAIGMCEIANFPEQFVSRHPHYVVNNLDWIQCRFLFVRYYPTAAALELPSPNPSYRAWRGYLRQDSQLHVTGLNNLPVEIPASAIPSTGRAISSDVPPGTNGKPGSPTKKPSTDMCAEIMEGLDIDGVLGDEPQVSVKKRRVSDRRTDFLSGTVNWDSLPKLPEPTGSLAVAPAGRTLARELKEMHKTQENELQKKGDLADLGWYVEVDRVTNLLHWIVELHTFNSSLPLAQDMKKKGITSIVLELRMGENYPLTPPFVRVIRPRFLSFQMGGGGHVTAGGAICSELLTNSGWLPSLGIEKVLLQVKLGLEENDPPARLDPNNATKSGNDYGIWEAVEAYKRAAQNHGWTIPKDLNTMVASWGGH